MRIRRNQRVEVSCPNCANAQWEAAIAVSTFCRSCGEHFDISNGKAVANGNTHADHAYLRVSSEEAWSGDAAPETNSPRRAANESKRDARGTNPAPADDSPFSSRRNVSGNGSRNERRGVKPKLQTVACFECGHKQEVNAFAASSICPSCKAHISLRQVHVRNDSREKIRTRGDVTIHRRAALHGSSLACRDLKVLGRISGRVDCTGDASFYSECRILGVFSCATLSVRNKAVVHFERPVYARHIVVTGEVRGNFYCSGTVTIGKSGSLEGEIIARAITVEPGGKLAAGTRVCPQEPPVAPPAPAELEGEVETEKIVLAPAEREPAAPERRPRPAIIDAAATSPAV